MTICRHAVRAFLLLLIFVPFPTWAHGATEATSPVPGVEAPFDWHPVAPGAERRVSGHVGVPHLAGKSTDEWAAEWVERIDATWGPSPLTVPQMLALFDTFWGYVDANFACFQDLDVDWLALRNRYRPEVALDPSRGRFAAIMNHLAMALRESHTAVNDQLVNGGTALTPGTPLMVVGGWGDNAHFGAGLTPQPDGSLLVYKAVPGHPLGIEAGDLVLGYDGTRWSDLYPKLLAAHLPLAGWWWGSSPASFDHSLMMSAGMNWHLFETIDLVRHATGDTVHLPVAPMALLGGSFDCTEQLAIPGVTIPNWPEQFDPVSWGVVTGTTIGYVYGRAWAGTAGTEFFNAIDSLTSVIPTTGLIIDFRTNYGGNMFLAYPALARLFDRDVNTIGFVQRCSAADHLAMCPSPGGPPSQYVIHGDPATFYDRPIAVLVGPGAISSGDQVANLFKFRPNTRFFGRTTSTAFNAPATLNLLQPGWSGRVAVADAYLVNNPTNYLTHDEFAVDDPVWLNPDDVAQRYDTVVGAALQWIGIPAAADRAAPQVTAASPNPFGERTTLRYALPTAGPVRLAVYDVAGRLVRTLLEGAPAGAGSHAQVWDARDDHGRLVPPGLYLARLESRGRVSVRRMIRVE